MHRGGLLGEQHGIHPIRGDEDRRRQLDPIGDRGGGAQRDQRLEVRVGDPVDRPQGSRIPAWSRFAPTRSAARRFVPGTAFGSPIPTSISAPLSRLPSAGANRAPTRLGPRTSRRRRVARLAFLDSEDRPRVLPITFAIAGGAVWERDRPQRAQREPGPGSGGCAAIRRPRSLPSVPRSPSTSTTTMVAARLGPVARPGRGPRDRSRRTRAGGLSASTRPTATSHPPARCCGFVGRPRAVLARVDPSAPD